MFGIKKLKKRIEEAEIAIGNHYQYLDSRLRHINNVVWKLNRHSVSSEIDIQIKKIHSEAILPDYASDKSAGLDLYVRGTELKPSENLLIVQTGIAVDIPEGYVGLIVPVKTNFKTGLQLANSIETIQHGDRSELVLNFRTSDLPAFNNDTSPISPFNQGDVCGQLFIVKIPKVTIQEVDMLSMDTTEK